MFLLLFVVVPSMPQGTLVISGHLESLLMLRVLLRGKCVIAALMLFT